MRSRCGLFSTAFPSVPEVPRQDRHAGSDHLAVPCVRSGQGRPKKRPNKLHADKTYDHSRCRKECRARSIVPRIARRGVETSERLGRHRWGVKRTLVWLNRFRRLTIRYERRADIHEAFVTLGCAFICLNQIRRFC
jgi:transposase